MSFTRRRFLAGAIGAAGIGTLAIGYSTYELFQYEAFSWQPLNSRNHGPLARLNHSMAYDHQNDQLLVFGGSAQGGFLNDVWSYDFENNWWIELSSQNEGPNARRNATAQYDEDQDCMHVAGGEGEVAYHDHWTYDLSTQSWIKTSDASGAESQYQVSMAQHPQPRVDYAEAQAINEQRVLVYGGSQQFQLLNDVWSFDVQKEQWTELNTTGQQPEARERHRAVWVPGRGLVVFGGLGQQPLNDLWLLKAT